EHAFGGEVWDKAVVYGRQGGTKAFARSALREAVACYEQALIALRHLPENRATQEQAIDLRFGLRDALSTLGDVSQVLGYLQEAKTLAEALDDQLRLGRASAYLCRSLTGMGGYDGAIASGQYALAVAEALRDVALQLLA